MHGLRTVTNREDLNASIPRFAQDKKELTHFYGECDGTQRHEAALICSFVKNPGELIGNKPLGIGSSCKGFGLEDMLLLGLTFKPLCANDFLVKNQRFT